MPLDDSRYDERNNPRPPRFFELGHLPGERYPDLHERQIEENRKWRQEREERVEGHAQRVQQQLKKHSHRRSVTTTHGKRQEIWCVELCRRFESVSAAGDFVGRSASNILQAIRLGIKCGPYHWDRFDPARHKEQAEQLQPLEPAAPQPAPPAAIDNVELAEPVPLHPPHANNNEVHMPNAPMKQKLLLVNHCSPGDVLMLTAAVRDLHRAWPGEYLTAVETRCPDLWLHNPYISRFKPDEPGVLRIDCNHPPLLDRCNGQPRHYIESMHHLLAQTLKREVPLTRFAPDLHLSEPERQSPPAGLEMPYWVVLAGGKRDMTTKWWPAAFCQQVVDHFAGRLRFVQAGAGGDHHPLLRGVVSRVGKTSLRDFVRLICHAEGVLCPITAAMHLAAAFAKPCVVVAGGREPAHWEMYPEHQYLHTLGQLACCRQGGCWKARVVALNDGDLDRDNNLCAAPSQAGAEAVAACMGMIEPADVCRAIERYIRGAAVQAAELNEANAASRFEAAAQSLTPYPGGHEGRGIVIPGGGPKYFPCAWVCINMLRETGCTLPIELWHIGPAEMSPEMRSLVEPLGVRCVDALEVRKRHPIKHLGGWELKAYAILHSRFCEVLLLDADNVPVVDPSFLFDAPQYRAHGAVFWPDYGRLGPDRRIWGLTGVAYRNEPEFESGQIVVDKERCWEPLSLALWMNENSSFWYRHIHGDKDTFHMAWRKLGCGYAMPATPIHRLPGVMCQHDMEGRRLFQHRNMAKWSVDGQNPRIAGFVHEDRCLLHLDHLRQRWLGRPSRPYNDQNADAKQRELARRLCAQRWLYRRVGHDQRPMTFMLDGRVQEGAGGCEQAWNFRADADGLLLCISGKDGLTCTLVLQGGQWKGRWLIHEQMSVELQPNGSQAQANGADAAAA